MGGAVSVDPTSAASQGDVSADVLMTISDFVDSISVISGTATLDSGTGHGTSQSRPAGASDEIFTIREVPSWVQPIRAYLTEGLLPKDEAMVRKIQRRSKSYTIVSTKTYKRSVTGVLQRCVEPAEGQEILLDIHQGECGHHVLSRALVAKAFRHGFYWPSALQDAEDIVRKCNGCQRYSKLTHLPQSALKTIPITWPFATWCLDMVGPLRPAKGNMTHILVIVDKFTKWVEVKPIRKLDGYTAVKFVKDIILR